MGASNVIREIRRSTRRRFTSEEKIRIVVEGLRGEITMFALCRQKGIAPAVYYRWSKSFLDACKNGLTRDFRRDATFEEVKRLKQEKVDMKKALAEAVLGVQKFKKSLGM